MPRSHRPFVATSPEQADALARIASLEAKRHRAALAVGKWSEQRDDAIRQALAAGVPVRAAVAASGLSRERVYQIRDGRR